MGELRRILARVAQSYCRLRIVMYESPKRNNMYLLYRSIKKNTGALPGYGQKIRRAVACAWRRRETNDRKTPAKPGAAVEDPSVSLAWFGRDGSGLGFGASIRSMRIRKPRKKPGLFLGVTRRLPTLPCAIVDLPHSLDPNGCNMHV